MRSVAHAGAAKQVDRRTTTGWHEPAPEILTTEEVATWVRVSQSTLCRWRQVGKGPRVTWLSETTPRYRRVDVETWLDRALT